MVNAAPVGTVFEPTYNPSYSDAIVGAAADSAPASDAIAGRRSGTAVATADTAHATDAVTAVFHPMHFTTASDVLPATRDAAVATLSENPAPPSDVGGLHLRVYDVTGGRLLSVIPELESATVQDERNQPGQLALSVPRSAPGVGELALAPSALITLLEQGRPVGTFLYDEDSDDAADAAGADGELSVTAPGILQVLDWAAVYPEGGFGAPLYADFVQLSPGEILLTVLSRAQDRGTLDGVNGPYVTCSFTAEADSDGTPWPASVWVRYDAGKSMLDVVNDLTSRGYVDVSMRSTTLDAYVANGAPDLSRSPVTPQVSADARGWQAVAGCNVARDAAVVPSNVPGVTASTRITGFVTAVADLELAVKNAQAVLHDATVERDADVATINKRANTMHRPITASEKAVIAADEKAVTTAQKAYAAAQANLANALNEVPSTDATAQTVATFPVLGGVGYDVGIDVHADAVTRVVMLSLEFTDAAGADLGGQTVASTTDSPSGWALLSGQVTTPVTAVAARAVVKHVAIGHGEMHYVARLAASPSVGTTMTVDRPDVVLHRPTYVQSGARRRQRSTVRTALLGLGEANLSLEAADPDAIALYGRREGAASQGGIADFPTLQKLTQLALDQQKRPTIGWTVQYARETGDDTESKPPQPWRDYRVGNMVRCGWIRWPDLDPTSTSVALAPVRVSSITAAYDATGVRTATVELADIFVDKDVQAQRQITGLLMGASSADPLGATPVEVDVLAPSPVDAAVVLTSTIANPDGTYQALAAVSWPAVRENTDGSTFDDLGAYTVDYRIGYWPDETGGWQGAHATQGTEAGFGQLPVGGTFQARVIVTDFNGNFPTNADGSPAYTYTDAVTLTDDSSPPAAPDAPALTPLAGGIAVEWDGRDVAGQPMPPSFDHVEFHVSTVLDFTPTVATLADTYHGDPAGANTTLTPPRLAYGNTYYVRLVAVSSTDKRSDPGVLSAPAAMRLIGPADLDPAVLTDTDHSGMFAAEDWTAGGSLVADGAARSGEARQLAAGQSTTGPGYTGLKPGRYRATFVLRTDAVLGALAANVATVDVTGAGVQSDGQAVVTTRAVAAGQGYRTVSVKFTVNAQGSAVALAVANPYGGNVWLSHAYVEPVTSLGVAEVRDEFVADLSATKLTAGTMTADIIAAQDANGNPGRIRVGIVDPATGLPTAPGIEVGSRGIRAQTTGGATTLLIDPTTGQVQVTGSIQAGSSLPGSVYAANLVQNASMEDPVPGTVAGTAGVVPAGWTDGYENIGVASTAYADQAGSIGGSQSLTIRNDDTASGRSVASSGFAVVPGERLQVTAQFKQTGVLGPVFVRVVFGTSGPSFPRSATVGPTPRKPDNCLVLALDGTVVDTPTPFSGAGYVDVLHSYTPPVIATAYKATGSVVVPAGATWARLVLYGWARGGATAGSTFTTWDNTAVIRSQDGHTLIAATITGPVIQTATSGPRVVVSSTTDTRGIYLYSSDASTPPAQIVQSDYQWGGKSYSEIQFTAVDSGATYPNKTTFQVGPWDGAIWTQGTGWHYKTTQINFNNGSGPLNSASIYAPTSVSMDDTIIVNAQYDGGAPNAGTLQFISRRGTDGAMVAGISLGYCYYDAGGGRKYFTQITGNVLISGQLAIYNPNDANVYQFNLPSSPTIAKTFVIDHPTDKDRWLVHAAVEGPEAAVYYRGRVTVRAGVAEVVLPSWFEAATLADGRTVQLTACVDVESGQCPRVAASYPAAGRFSVIADADCDVWWEVKAVRADVPVLDAEPRRDSVVAHGEGPYRWLTPRVASRP